MLKTCASGNSSLMCPRLAMSGPMFAWFWTSFCLAPALCCVRASVMPTWTRLKSVSVLCNYSQLSTSSAGASVSTGATWSWRNLRVSTTSWLSWSAQFKEATSSNSSNSPINSDSNRLSKSPITHTRTKLEKADAELSFYIFTFILALKAS